MLRYSTLFLAGYLATLHYWTLFFSMDDEAYTTLQAMNILHGEFPYRDWIVHHTPGPYWLTAIWFFLFGSGQLGTRSLFSLISALIGLCIQNLADKQIKGRLRYLPWLFWTCHGVIDTPHLNYHWFGVLAASLALVLTCRWPEQPKISPWLGASVALSIWCLQSNGLTAMATLVLVWLRLRPQGLKSVISGFIATSFLLWLPAAPWASLALKENFLDLGGHMRVAVYPYSWQPIWDHSESFRHIPLEAGFITLTAAWSYWLITLLRFGLYYPIISLNFIRSEWSRDRQHLPLAWAGLAWMLTVGPRQEVGYVAFNSPVFYVILVYLCQSLRASWLIWAWGILELIAYPCRVSNRLNNHPYPVYTRAGLYYASDPVYAQAYNEVEQFIEKNCPPGSNILAYEYIPSLYTLNFLHNPIRHPILLPCYSPENAFIESAQRIRELKVPFIFQRQVSGEEFSKKSILITATEFNETSERYARLMLADYEEIARNPVFRIWRRKPGL